MIIRNRLTLLIFTSSVSIGAITPVPITDVHLSDQFWLPLIKTVQEQTIPYALEKCATEGRLENFLIAGGQMQGTTRGAMPFDDTDVYKIIEGASNSLLSSPDPALEKRLEAIIATIAIGQEKDGYLTTWRTIDGQHPPAPWVQPGERWHHLAASHELYNAGHLFEAAAVHHAATGSTALLDIATRYADLLVRTFGSGKLETVPGHQIVETGLIKLYRITDRRDYLELAKYFLDHRGIPGHHPLFGSYSQDHIPAIAQREVVGHAVRAVYMYAGMTDIAELYHDDAYLTASRALWENMTSKKLYLTGGIGARAEGEAFGDNYELPNATAYAETCAAIGSVIWSQRLHHLTGDVADFDLIERTLYNGLISGLSLDGTHFFYPNSLAADKTHAFNRGHLTRAEWFDCSCCPTNLIRFLPSLPGYLYARHNDDTLAVNLYAANQATVILADTNVQLSQKTRYPWDGNIILTVTPAAPAAFTVKLRIPGWARNVPAPGGLYHYTDGKLVLPPSLALNGEPVNATLTDGYLSVYRTWQPGDSLHLTLDMPVRRVASRPEVAELTGQVALERGPLVYCFEEPDNSTPIAEITLSPDLNFSPRSTDLLGGITTLVATFANGTPVTAIPYYVWSNRGISSMKVWAPAP